MRLENLLDVVHGELLNSPIVSSFSGIASELENVKHSYLFFAYDISTIEQALQKGAYGIVVQDSSVALDEESAFIFVEDMDEALVRLFRFRLLQGSVKRYMLKTEEAVIIQKLCSKKELLVFEDMCKSSMDEFFENPRDVVFTQSVFFNRLGVECVEFEKRRSVEVYASGIFSCEVYIEKPYKIEFCSFFAHYLANALSFLLENSYELNRSKLFDLPMLTPLFLNKNREVVEFGKSSRVVVCESRARIFQKAVELFYKDVKWGKNIYLAPMEIGIEDSRIVIYSDSEDLKSILEANEFNYALVLMPKNSDYLEFFKREEEEKLLF